MSQALSRSSAAIEVEPCFRRRWQNFLLAFALGAAILIPVFWQPHVQAGDLSSHMYNAWLVGEIRAGKIPGLIVEVPVTNVLSDLALEHLFRIGGRQLAERITVGIAVETFFWGAFMFVGALSGRRAWFLTPILAMLTYGLIFQFGFLNFYVSAGLSLWVAALLWQPNKLRVSVSVALAILAFLAHVMPVAILAAGSIYIICFRRIPFDGRFTLLVSGLAVMIALQAALVLWASPLRFISLQPTTLMMSLGIQQLLIYGSKYWIVATGVTALCAVLFAGRLNRGELWSQPATHLWVLSIAAFHVMPDGIRFHQYSYPLLFIPHRITLLTAVLFCAMIGDVKPRWAIAPALTILASLYFGALYFDVRALNVLEDEVRDLVREMLPGQRLVGAFADSGSSQLNGAVHITSAACLGYCFDYANYEPATKQFRVRALQPNFAVASDVHDVEEFESGMHVVRGDEGELYEICRDNSKRGLVLRKLLPGEKNCRVALPVTPQPF